jgi:hypothetical protein
MTAAATDPMLKVTQAALLDDSTASAPHRPESLDGTGVRLERLVARGARHCEGGGLRYLSQGLSLARRLYALAPREPSARRAAL